MAALLRLENVWKMLGGRWVLRGVSLALGPGEAVVVSGANGSGKTTLLRLSAGLAEPSRGRVSWGCPRGPRGCVGYVGHTPMVYGDLTVWENVEFFSSLHGGSLGDYPLAAEAWRLLGLEKYGSHLASQLSFGWRRRLDVVRALLGEPRLLLLDEAFTGLDQGASEALSRLLRLALGEGLALLMTTPLLEPRYLGLASRVYTLQDGLLAEAS
ncbi:heme exporter protein A [Aeropyrum pernix K1]|uniref:Heme exporter protein A n=1 Tax=Aeropyrum pernix (strain ATCC 700893 / DSM 11879 / JCM 9820 / NBRC 100138 / K1) TaxID=272557 RepID=Q9YD86_AERPE|nr:ABC transporter ATP-binding protein [Aeropyrum pernix]BAA80011.2 heme exporter protein A [Aeropyrum pernix K1]